MNILSRLEVVKKLKDSYPYIDCADNTWLHKDHDEKLWLTRLNPNIDPAEEEYEDIEIDTPKKLMSVIKQYFDKHPLVYVNAYEVHRVYCSPAEGGIWRDEGEPVASVPVLKKNNNVENVIKILEEALGDQYVQPHGRTRFSVIGGPDLVIYVEDHPAKRWPDGPFVYE